MAARNLARLEEAIRWAAELHSGQFREGEPALPYITHPLDVIAILYTIGDVKDEDILVAAALHDTIEESGTHPGDIGRRCGERVRELVLELTREEPDEETAAKLSKSELTALRSRMLLEEIARMSPEAMTVKLADRISNLREAYRTRTGKRLERYVVQSAQILDRIPKSVNPKMWKALRELVERY